MRVRSPIVGLSLVLCGVACVPLGIFVSLQVPVSEGLDDYVPPFFGLIGGSAVGLPLVLTGLAALVMAWQRRRAAHGSGD